MMGLQITKINDCYLRKCDLQYRGVLISGCHVIYSIEVSSFQGVM